MARKTVALLIHDGVQALDVAGPLDVFAEANGFLPDNQGYDLVLLAAKRESVNASNGMPLMAHFTYAEAARRFDTVLVAGGPALPDTAEDSATSAWLARWGVRGGLYGSICTGAFILGHAGLLDSRTVTTHWQAAAQLATMFPAARVEPDRIFSRDGPLVTSAGVTAGIDLVLELVADDHGAAVSLACAKRLLVVTQRQGGQSQFSPLLQRRLASGTPLRKVQDHVLAHVGEPFPVERLAEIAGDQRPKHRETVREGDGADPARLRRKCQARPGAQPAGGDGCGVEGGGIRLRLRGSRADARRLPAAPWSRPAALQGEFSEHPFGGPEGQAVESGLEAAALLNQRTPATPRARGNGSGWRSAAARRGATSASV